MSVRQRSRLWDFTDATLRLDMTSCLTWRMGSSLPSSRDVRVEVSFHRFGGGSELLRDGDKNNMWSIIEEGMVYGQLVRFRLMVLTKSGSFATVLHTLTWLGAYLFKIPGSLKPLLAMQQTTARLAEARLKRGSKTRDLYYYLVSDICTQYPPQEFTHCTRATRTFQTRLLRPYESSRTMVCWQWSQAQTPLL